MMHVNGTSIAVYFDTLEELCVFMQLFRLFDCWNINKFSEFELPGLDKKKTCHCLLYFVSELLQSHF